MALLFQWIDKWPYDGELCNRLGGSSPLEKVFRSTSIDLRFTSLRSWIKLQECFVKRLVYFHYSRLIPAPIAIIWSTENSHDSLFMTPVIPIHHQLMSSTDQIQPIWTVRKYLVCPNVKPAPRGEIPHPLRSSGPLQITSHIGPLCGTSWTRLSCLTWSRVSMLGLRLPWRQTILFIDFVLHISSHHPNTYSANTYVESNNFYSKIF